MPTKVAELRQDHRGDRQQCPICCPRSNCVTNDRLWQWSQCNPGQPPFRNQTGEARGTH